MKEVGAVCAIRQPLGIIGIFSPLHDALKSDIMASEIKNPERGRAETRFFASILLFQKRIDTSHD
jgi:hypothetical protein